MAIGVLPRDRNIVHEQVMARDLRTTGNKWTSHTLGNAGTATTFTLPDWATGVKIYPVANSVTIGFGETPTQTSATSGTTLDFNNAGGTGGYAKNDLWETRIFDNPLSAANTRTLVIMPTVNATVVYVELF